MRVIMDRREMELLPPKVVRALQRLEQAIMDSDWHGVQVTMTRVESPENFLTTVDIQMKED